MKNRSPFLLFVFAVVVTGLFGCDGTEQAIDCGDICVELESCFEEDFDSTQCVDSCEDRSEAAVETCDLCLDESERECSQCTAECSSFITRG